MKLPCIFSVDLKQMENIHKLKNKHLSSAPDKKW